MCFPSVASISWQLMRTRGPAPRIDPSRIYRTPSLRARLADVDALALEGKAEVRDTTKSQFMRASEVVRSSTTPSAIPSPSSPPPNTSNGSTAMEALSAGGSMRGARPPRWAVGQNHTPKRREMFFNTGSPPYSHSISTLPTISSWTRSEKHIPPGSANCSRRAATLTPSPWMSAPVAITSPK